ncbi:hypothetical protein GS426_06645 [Rhodococcus hoagii]|nr:hypothetical protein [Prescottella equi]
MAHGSRAVTGTPAAEVYDNLVGPLPAVARRTVWVALRFDAAADGASVARRGGGEEGAARTVAVAARRVVRALGDAGYASASCPRPTWSRRPRSSVAASTPTRWTSSGPMSRSRPVQHRQRDRTPASQPRTAHRGVGAPRRRDDRHGAPASPPQTRIRTRRCRVPDHHPCGAVPRSAAPGPDLDAGRHRDALVAHCRSRPRISTASLPCSQPTRPTSTACTCRWPVAGNSSVRTPGPRRRHPAVRSRCARRTGRRRAVPGAAGGVPGCGDRCAGAGPHRQTSCVDDTGRGDRRAQTTSARSRIRLAETGFDTLVVDGPPAPPARPGVTAVHVQPTAAPASATAPTVDVSILQPGASGDRVILTTGGRSIDLALVTISSETAFLGRPRPSRLVGAH